VCAVLNFPHMSQAIMMRHQLQSESSANLWPSESSFTIIYTAWRGLPEFAESRASGAKLVLTFLHTAMAYWRLHIFMTGSVATRVSTRLRPYHW
jgi:hypothetical protein